MALFISPQEAVAIGLIDHYRKTGKYDETQKIVDYHIDNGSDEKVVGLMKKLGGIN